MTLEKEMIRLFDGGGTGEKEDSGGRDDSQRQQTCQQRHSVPSSRWKSNMSHHSPKLLNDNKNEQKICCTRNEKNRWRLWDCLENFSLRTNICNAYVRTAVLFYLLIFLPQLCWSSPLPKPQLIVRSQSLLFSNQYGRQIDLTNTVPTEEVFWLNFEEGYFACQVNASEKFLKLFRLSRLCDGEEDCYKGTDELTDTLKCSRQCTPDSSCSNHGVCLDMSVDPNSSYQNRVGRNAWSDIEDIDSRCICDDGYGGRDCSTEDVNECQFRPCSSFADCINTIGSYECECWPGYTGDGHTCDISREVLDVHLDSHNVVSNIISSSYNDTPTFGIASSWVPVNDSIGVSSSYIPVNESFNDPLSPPNIYPETNHSIIQTETSSKTGGDQTKRIPTEESSLTVDTSTST